MKNVLVTGGAGFIGSHLCEKLLETGCNVTMIDNFNNFYDPGLKRRNIRKALEYQSYHLLEGDIGDAAVVAGAIEKFGTDTVFHLAALAGVRKSLENPLEYIDVDIRGTVNLLEQSRIHKLKRFVFASSSSVYGTAAPPFHEGMNISSQVSPYAASKASGELFCNTYSNLYSLPVVCLRFFTVYGPRQRPEMAIHHFTKLIREGKPIPLFGDGTSHRDYTYIDDIVDGIIAAAKYECRFEIFNLGNSKAVQLNELADLIGRSLEKEVKKNYLNIQAGDVPGTLADIGKAEKLLRYQPKVSIREGIERFVQWFLEEQPQ